MPISVTLQYVEKIGTVGKDLSEKRKTCVYGIKISIVDDYIGDLASCIFRYFQDSISIVNCYQSFSYLIV